MSGVLVDTSVWIDHFRNRSATLVALLSQDLACTHPMVIGELACGTPPAPRTQTLRDLGLLPTVQHASIRETMEFIERESLYGLGCGLIDLVLLTSTLLTPDAKLWTLDQRLAKLAHRFGVAHQFP
jgi:predicted nucleic acid-binding protein